MILNGLCLTNLGTGVPLIRIHHIPSLALIRHIYELLHPDTVTTQRTAGVPLCRPDYVLDTAAAEHVSTVGDDGAVQGVQADCTLFVYS